MTTKASRRLGSCAWLALALLISGLASNPASAARFAPTSSPWDLAVDTGRILARYHGPTWRLERWRVAVETPAGHLVLLPDLTEAYADYYTSRISADGTIVMGLAVDRPPTKNRLFRWTASAGITCVATLNPSDELDSLLLSADGNTLVGRMLSANLVHGYRWTTNEGLKKLPEFHDIYAVSADGSILLASTFLPSVVRVDPIAGRQVLPPLPVLNGFSPFPSSFRMTPDGNTVIATASPWTRNLYRWRSSVGSWEVLGETSTSTDRDLAGISADGKTVLGKALWIWREGFGTESIASYLAGFGITPVDRELRTCEFMAPNARSFGGTAYGPNDPWGPTSAGWAVYLDDPLQTPKEAPSQSRPALAIEVNTRLDNLYRVQQSEDLQTWTDSDPSFLGVGGTRYLWHMTDTAPLRFFRVIETP